MPDTVEERKRLTDELVELARRLDDPGMSFWAAAASAIAGVETGDRRRVESGLATVRSVAASVPDASMAWAPLVYEAHWALVQGELEAAEQWAIQAFEAGTASGQPDAVVFFGVMVFQVRYFQGRTGELVEQSVRLAEKPESDAIYHAPAALTLIESDRAGEARELALAENFQTVPWDWNWSWTMFLWADVCCRLRLVDRAGELYDLLAPFSRQSRGRGWPGLGLLRRCPRGTCRDPSSATSRPRPTSLPPPRSRSGSVRRCSSPSPTPAGHAR